VDELLETIAAARENAQPFTPRQAALMATNGEWNVPLIGQFWSVLNDPQKCNFPSAYLQIICSILRKLDAEPRTPSTIRYLKTRQREKLQFDSENRLLGIPLFLHSLDVAAWVIEAEKKTKEYSGKLAGSYCAANIIVALSHDLGKLNSILNEKIRFYEMDKKGPPSISVNQHALYSRQVLERVLVGGHFLEGSSRSREIKERILLAIEVHHRPVWHFAKIEKLMQARAEDMAKLLVKADHKTRETETKLREMIDIIECINRQDA